MIVAGLGFSTRASLASIRDALERAQCGHPPVTALATLADKAPLLDGLARTLGLPLIPVAGPLPDTPTRSDRALAERGAGSVAEACALAAVGQGGYLRQTRVISGDRLATCAIAQGGNA